MGGESQEPENRPEAPPAGRGWGAALIARLQAVGAEAAAPEDALEPALEAILDATRVQAGALCLFDARHGILRLAAERGLSDEGCHRLQTVRRGDPSTWDMPLHGLVNRAAYLIESAAQNRYVPPLIAGRVPVRTVACVPFYGATEPLGTLILVAVAPRSLAERDIVALARPLTELAALVRAVRRKAGVPEEVPSPGVPAPRIDVVALSAERDSLIAERDELAAELAAGAGEREQLAAELAALAGARDHLEADLDAALVERDALAEDLERVRRQAARVTELEAALARAEHAGGRHDNALAAAVAERDAERARVAELERVRIELARRADALGADLERARAAAAEQVVAAERRVADQAREIARLGKRLEDASAHTRDALDQEERERRRLTAELESATRRERQARDELQAATAQHQAALEAALETARVTDAARDAAETTLEAARARLASAEQAAGAATAAAHRADEERTRLAVALEAAAAREAELRAELEAVDAGQAAGGQVALAAAHESLRLAEAARATAEAEAAATAARLEQTQAVANRLEAKLQQHEAERVRLVAELRAVAAREEQLRGEILAAEARRVAAAGSELAAGREAIARAEAEQTAARAEAEAARTERRAAEARLAEVEAELERMRVAHGRETDAEQSAAAQRARLALALETTQAAEAELRGRLAAAEREASALRAERERAQAIAQSRVDEQAALQGQLDVLASQRDAARSALSGIEAERDRLRTELAAQAAAHARLDEALARETSARAHLAAELAESRRIRQELMAAGVAPVAAPTDAGAGAPAPVAEEKVEEPIALPRPAQVVRLASASAKAPAEKSERGGTARVVVVLDTDAAWNAAGAEDRRIVLVRPAAEAAGEIARLEPDRVILNLAVPEALGVALALRTKGCRARLWGTIAAAGEEGGLALGMIEPAVHPLDPEVIIDVLGGFVAKGGRVITAGADVDGLMSLRQALSRQRVSVSMAWDAKQVADVLPVVRPTAVVVDLDLPRRDGYTIAAGLSAIDPVPHAILIGGVEDAPKAFAALLADARHGSRAVARGKLVEMALARSEDPPLATVAELSKPPAHRAPSRVRQVAWGK